jgi:phospholipid/cholesterol/gamma-HCH transport system ATP-binding protein
MATSDSLPNPELSGSLIPEIADLLPDSDAESLGHGQFGDGTSWPLISFSHVSMWFGERKVLDDVSFSVNRGETLCILGRSGVGKSVALRILMGFLKPQVGSIRLGGEEINGYTEEDMRSVRKRVTMVFQNGALFDSMSVKENVAFPLREHGGLLEDQVTEIVDRLTPFLPAFLQAASVRLPLLVRWLRSLKWCSTTSQPRWSIPLLRDALATSFSA